MLYDQITMSKRNNIIILPKVSKTNTFLFTATKIWNLMITQLKIKNEPLFLIKPSFFKLKLKTFLFETQALNDPTKWDPYNFYMNNYHRP